jgi:hypothetical protein
VSAIETVLWQQHGATCMSLVVDSGHIEIRVTVNDEVTDRVIFADTGTAVLFANEMMHDRASD